MRPKYRERDGQVDEESEIEKEMIPIGPIVFPLIQEIQQPRFLFVPTITGIGLKVLNICNNKY